MLVNKFLSRRDSLIGRLYFTNKNNNFYQQIIKPNFHKYFELFKLGDYYKGHFYYEFKNDKNKIDYISSRLEIKGNSLDCNRLYLVEEIQLRDSKTYYFDYRLGWQTRLCFNNISIHKVPLSIRELIGKKSDKDIIVCSVNK
jgi:hypothetical protein